MLVQDCAQELWFFYRNPENPSLSPPPCYPLTPASRCWTPTKERKSPVTTLLSIRTSLSGCANIRVSFVLTNRSASWSWRVLFQEVETRAQLFRFSDHRIKAHLWICEGRIFAAVIVFDLPVSSGPKRKARSKGCMPLERVSCLKWPVGRKRGLGPRAVK